MTYDEAVMVARIESENGYVQHVNRIQKLGTNIIEYIVSDWFDDTTVASFENGYERNGK